LVKLIGRSVVRCGDHCRSAGPLRGAGLFAQCQGATPLKTGLTIVCRHFQFLWMHWSALCCRGLP